MDSVRPVRSYQICRGCLSINRSLSPIEINMDLFLMLLGNNRLYLGDSKDEFCLCFECMALLRKVKMFQQRIQTAQDVFTKMLSVNWTPKQSLSQLTITKRDDYQLIISEDEYKIKTELNGSVSPVGNNCFNIDVKEEFDDIFGSCFNQNVIDTVKSETIVFESSFNQNLVDTGDTMKSESILVESCFHQNLVDGSDAVKRESNKISNVEKKFKVSKVKYSDEEKAGFVVPVVMKLNDLLEMPKKNRKGVYYKNMVNSCSRFISMMGDLKESDLQKKDKPGTLRCTHCKAAITDQNDMKLHWDNHTVELYQCILCNIYSKQRFEVINHITERHSKLYECHECAFKCWKSTDINNHYKDLHKFFVCDQCNKKFTSRFEIEGHLRRKHLPLVCHVCSKPYKHLNHLQQHLSSHEPGPTELTYCVECDRQFVSQYGYKRHLRTSVAHRPKNVLKVPCPDCDKVFSRKVYMNNHYKQVHVRKSQHYCEICDKYFINGYAIRTHKKFVHEKNEKPKNKICEICNRGFHTNRVLINHKRTHTGERPFSCNYCSASFAQLQAKKTHERTQHKTCYF